MPSPSRVLLASGCLVLVLAGCSDDDPGAEIDPGDSSSAAATPTSAPSPSGPVEPTLPVAAQGDDAAAAEAFVRFYWETANYAQQALDAAAIDAWSSDACSGCVAVVQFLRDIERKGGSIRGGEASISRLRTRKLTAGDGELFEVTFDVSNSTQTVDLPGTQDDIVHDAATVTDRFLVSKRSGDWQLVRWSVL